ncbi:Rha family transcriptional regulator [Candidatus Sodalis pierantonius]|nr:Rha family transcriptional regulator [Candidatus Sodalis pierantonius]
MQNLTIAQTLTMSSREIAELTEKQHKHRFVE